MQSTHFFFAGPDILGGQCNRISYEARTDDLWWEWTDSLNGFTALPVEQAPFIKINIGKT